MAREKRVVLILVEGPSDENALLEPMQAALNFAANGAPPEARALAFHCDVTTVRPFSWEASFAVKDRVRDTVRQFVVDRIASRHEYEWTDLDRIIHIVDLDGAFIPNECIVEGDCDGFVYGRDSITARDTARVVDRNERKSAALLELAGTRELKHRKHAVPYRVYFMSRNLEHALYGSVREFSDDEKRQLSAAFGKKSPEPTPRVSSIAPKRGRKVRAIPWRRHGATPGKALIPSTGAQAFTSSSLTLNRNLRPGHPLPRIRKPECRAGACARRSTFGSRCSPF